MSEYIVNVPDKVAEPFIAQFEFVNVKLFGYSMTGEIVRCRDCKHYADHEWITSPQYGLGSDFEHVCHFWHGKPTKVAPEGFCSYGERKERNDHLESIRRARVAAVGLPQAADAAEIGGTMGNHLWIKDESKVLTTYPPKYAWECARCGGRAITSGGMPSTDGCVAHASLEKLRTRIGESGFTLAQRVQMGTLVDEAELQLKLAEGRRKTERNNFEQVCKQRDRLKEQLKVLQAEVNELREKVGRMAETDSRWEAMRRDLENTIAERDECYMKLPVDADGVPIRPGDTLVRGENMPFKVLSIDYNDNGVRVFNENSFGITHCEYRHVKPDHVKELLKELMGETIEWCHYSGPMSGTRTQSEIIADYAERIRKAVKDGD